MQTRMWRRVIRLKWEFHCYLPLLTPFVCVGVWEIKFIFLSTLMHGWKYANKKSNNHDKVTQKQAESWKNWNILLCDSNEIFLWQDLKVHFLTLFLRCFLNPKWYRMMSYIFMPNLCTHARRTHWLTNMNRNLVLGCCCCCFYCSF